MHSFDRRQLAAILAGLRTVQRLTIAPGYHNLPEGVDDVLTSAGEVQPLTVEEIDDLCERINLRPKAAPSDSDPIGALFDLVEPMLTEFDDYRINGALKAARLAHSRLTSPSLLSLVKEATEAWANEFAEGEAGMDSEINGGDLLEWFSEWRVKAKAALESALDDVVEAAKRMMAEAARTAEPVPTELPSIAVVLEGGLVQSIITDMPGLPAVKAVYVIDYDTDGSDGNEVALVNQGDGSYSDAHVHCEGFNSAAVSLNDLGRELDAKEAAREAGWSYDRRLEKFTNGDGRDSDAMEAAPKSWTELCEAAGIEF